MFFAMPEAREQRPAFCDIPQEILDQIGTQTGSRVVNGQTVLGGFSASASFSLELADGRCLFAKGSHPGDLSHAVQNIRQEIAVYKYAPVLKSISPNFLGVVSDNDEDGWTLGLWDYIEHASSKPSVKDIVSVLSHIHTAPVPTNGLLPCLEKNYIQLFFTSDRKWHRVKSEPRMRTRFLSLFHAQDEANSWLDKNLDILCTLQQQVSTARDKPVLIHGDLHADNIFLGHDGKTYLVDWPNACLGPALFDVFFLGSVLESTQGVSIDGFLKAYDEAVGGVLTDQQNIQSLATAMAGFWADQASRENTLKMPRLRWIQKSMLLALLRFLACQGVIESIPRMANQRA